MKVIQVILIAMLFAFMACTKKTANIIEQPLVPLTESYLTDLSDWKLDRINYLKEPMGYMSLAGLYWLKEGMNSFGSGIENDLIFPQQFPHVMGTIDNKDGMFSVMMNENYKVKINDIEDNKAFLLADDSGHPTMMNYKSYFWYLIKRGERYGVRMKDTLSDARMNLESIPSFDVSNEWIVDAKFVPSTEGETIDITNVIGVTSSNKLAGYLHFKHEGKGYFLSALDAGKSLFVVFGDHTNGESTYGGGRFLYVVKPLEGNNTLLDFNRAENPICAFNDFATCPLPPEGNKLPFAIQAGEKKVRH